MTKATAKITPLEERCFYIKEGPIQTQIGEILPDKAARDRFTRAALMAIQNNPDLVKDTVDNKSLFRACISAATDNLLPDGKEAAFVTYYSKDLKKYVVNYLPMVQGIIKTLRESGQVKSIRAHTVKKRDIFRYIMGDKEEIIHEMPDLSVDRGETIGVYAIVELYDGGIERQIFDRADIKKRRECARTDKFWARWPDEKAEASVLHRLSKRLNLSGRAQQVVNRIEEEYDFAPIIPASKPAEAIPAESSTQKEKPSVADKIRSARKTKKQQPTAVEVEESQDVIDADDIPFGDDDVPI